MNNSTKINFVKYQGTGNDFIIIDGRDKLPELPVKLMCDRHFGIGADGLMILAHSNSTDFEMIYYNSDGNLSSMCGNGGRCIAHFAANYIFPNKNEFNFDAPDGMHSASVTQDNVSISMNDVSIENTENNGKTIIMNTGSPHFVSFEDIVDLQFTDWAKNIRYSDRFNKEGINVNNVRVNSENELTMRTYERGVEDETLSCGTGVTAAALSHSIRTNLTSASIAVNTKGGQLKVAFNNINGTFKNIVLTGEAKIVFEGSWNLK